MIRHFRGALNLIMKVRLSAKSLFYTKNCTWPRFHNEVQSSSKMALIIVSFDNKWQKYMPKVNLFTVD